MSAPNFDLAVEPDFTLSEITEFDFPDEAGDLTTQQDITDLHVFEYAELPEQLGVNDTSRMFRDLQRQLIAGLDVYSRRRKKPLKSHAECIIISLDTEYVGAEDGSGNIVLSYQYVVSYKGRRCSGIIYTNTRRKEGRIRFEKYIGEALNDALQSGIIPELPKAGDEILLAAHWLRADLFTFADAFDDFRTKVSGIRKTVASLKESYGIDPDEIGARRPFLEDITYYDPNRHAHTVNVTFYDTLLLTPGGKQSLAELGRLVGCKKLEIPEGFSIERMDEFLRDDPESFEAYAINDAMICSLFMDLIISFADRELGLKRLPFTLGGAAIKCLKRNLPVGHTLDKLFGYTSEKELIWPGEGDISKAPRTIAKRIPKPAREVLERMAVMCYHGGRNEAFHSGPTEEGIWHDYDAPSCYTAIAMGLREPDYDKFRETKDLADYRGDVLGIARVRFRTPVEVRYPTLPSRASNNRGLFFVREGESHCTAQEIEVALNLGVEVEIIYGFVIPWKSGAPRIFKRYMREVRRNRQSLKKQIKQLEQREDRDSEDIVNQRKALQIFEKLWKELGNSTYGKLAQGLRGKSAFDIKHGTSSKIPPSEITNALFAAYITGVARALMCEMLNGIKAPYRAVSVTTDGFLTNAPLDQINLDGPICRYFRELYGHIDPEGGEILEEKNRASQVIVAKTRGQATALAAEGWQAQRITAKAGIKVPDYEDDQNDYFVMLYLERHPGAKVDASSLTSTREMMLKQQDLIMNHRMQNMNLEPDCKRRLVNPRMMPVLDRMHLACDSVPHQTLSVGDHYRTTFDEWRVSNCLKDIEDWDNWDDCIEIFIAKKGSGMRLRAGEKSDGLLRRNFIRAYAREIHGLERIMSSADLAAWLTRHGYETKQSEVSSGKRAKLYHGVVPVTKRTVALLRLLLMRFPNFRYERFFYPERLPDLRQRLAEEE